MAVLSTLNPTLLDLAKRMDPDNKIADIVEMLNETNEVLDDMTFMEGNLPTGHLTTIRSGLPTPTWRAMYGGIQPTKSRTVQVMDNTGMLEMMAEVDKALADLNGNTAAFRLSEERAFLEGINQELANTIFYGNEGTQPDAFTGLAPRFNSLSAENADNIIVGGGSGADNRSIWLVIWGPNTVHGIIPKGSTAGIQMKDYGEVVLEDASDGSNTGRMVAYRTHYRLDAGLSVRDWRYIVRIPNIDFSALTVDASSGADLHNLMFEALRLPPNLALGRPAFYMARDVMTKLFQQNVNKRSSSTLASNEVGGKIVSSFMGVPLRRCDALSADEALVT